MDTDPTTAPAPTDAHGDTRATGPARRRRAIDPDPVGAYCDVVRRTVVRLVKGSFGTFDADDIAQRVVVKVLSDPERIMTRYPDPATFAYAAARRTGVDHLRREQVQRCEGSERRRTNLSLHAMSDHERDHVVTVSGGYDNTVDAALGRVAAEEILALVDDDLDRALLEQWALDGDRVTEIADDRGVSHPTVSKRLTRIRRDLKALLVDAEYVSVA